jgi:hypothetical protein
MAGSKDHTKISTTNIIKPAMEALPADDQRPFEDLVMRDEKEVMRRQKSTCHTSRWIATRRSSVKGRSIWNLSYLHFMVPL